MNPTRRFPAVNGAARRRAKRRRKPLRLGSLFSGFGGLDLAIEHVFGAKTVWVSDIKPGPCKVLAHHWPGVPNLGDITKIDWSQVEPVDIIAGGSPCQDISSAGRMAGMSEGTRSNLWVEMREAIRALRPTFVIWENVAAARSTKAASRILPDHLDRCIAHHLAVQKETHDPAIRSRHAISASRLMELRAGRVGVAYPKPALRALGRVLGDLASLGYDAQWYSLPASDVGAPHGRLRYFILAWRRDAAAHTAHLGHEWGGAHGTGGPDLRTAIGALADSDLESGDERRIAASGKAPGGGALGATPRRDRASVALLPTPTTQDGANAGGPSQFDRNTPPLNAVVALLPTPRATDGTKGGPNQRGSSGDLMLPSAVMHLPTPRATRGGSTTEIAYALGGARSNEDRPQGHVLLPTPSVADTQGGRKSRSGERSDELLLNGIADQQAWGPYQAAIKRWESVAGPAPAPTKLGRTGRPKLNPEFAAWMMGAPPGWITDVPGVTDNEALRMAGNGVVSRQAEVALRIMWGRWLQVWKEVG